MIDFVEVTGIGGYSYDYNWFISPYQSVYAQWRGWHRILSRL